jgi:hypothetical protein
MPPSSDAAIPTAGPVSREGAGGEIQRATAKDATAVAAAAFVVAVADAGITA